MCCMIYHNTFFLHHSVAILIILFLPRKITAKKGTGFYIRAAATFLRGTEEKPPVPSVILSGTGSIQNAATDASSYIITYIYIYRERERDIHALHYITLHYITLHYITLHYIDMT